jgi:hypothetical protein
LNSYLTRLNTDKMGVFFYNFNFLHSSAEVGCCIRMRLAFWPVTPISVITSNAQIFNEVRLEERVFLLLLLQEVCGLFSTNVHVPTKTEILSIKAALHNLKEYLRFSGLEKQWDSQRNISWELFAFDLKKSWVYFVVFS